MLSTHMLVIFGFLVKKINFAQKNNSGKPSSGQNFALDLSLSQALLPVQL